MEPPPQRRLLALITRTSGEGIEEVSKAVKEVSATGDADETTRSLLGSPAFK
jgi:hypothetical protein